MKREPDPFAPDERTAIRDDPFARAARPPGGDPTDTLLKPLAQRDPDAAPESTGVLVAVPESIDDMLRRARWAGFAAGVVVGAFAAAGAARLVAWWISTPPGP